MNERTVFNTGVAVDRTNHVGRTAQTVSDAETACPTYQLCAEMQYVFNRFNTRLFADELRPCMLTIDITRRSAYGYFRPDAFTTREGCVVDQISLNPDHLISRPMREVVGTIAHEMAHLWGYRCGGVPRTRSYHCGVWAEKMRKIGLMPSSTGRPGGRQTGYRMSHYAMTGGPFLAAAAQLEQEGFELTWGRFQAQLRANRSSTDGDKGRNKKARNGNPDQSKGKVKHRCPECAQACWGSPSLNLICGHDRQPLQRVGP